MLGDAALLIAAMFRRNPCSRAPQRQLVSDWPRSTRFRHALICACGSNALLETHAPVYDKYLRYQMIAGVFRGDIPAREHQELMKCALDRDSKTARDVLVVHIETCVDFTLENGKRPAI